MDRGIRSIAVVNRGEAAMRLINAVRELRYESVRDSGGGYADIRAIALHTAGRADGDVRARGRRGGVLDDDRRGAGARTSTSTRWSGRCVAARADAAWVGWGFVAERPEFAELCDAARHRVHRSGAEVMRRLGDKIGPSCSPSEADVPVARGAAARSRRSTRPAATPQRSATR